jgi:hypothetical protein
MRGFLLDASARFGEILESYGQPVGVTCQDLVQPRKSAPTKAVKPGKSTFDESPRIDFSHLLGTRSGW